MREPGSTVPETSIGQARLVSPMYVGRPCRQTHRRHRRSAVRKGDADRFMGSPTTGNYPVVVAKRSATPVRFDEGVGARLASFAAARAGLSRSAAANLLVDEGLRMAEHPGIVFRDGSSGRRAGLVGGPDVWEVIRAVKSARAAEPELAEGDVVSLVADNAGIPARLVILAVRYWASYPDEVEAQVAAAKTAESSAELAWQRQQDLLVG
jgi:hypothetical protein